MVKFILFALATGLVALASPTTQPAPKSVAVTFQDRAASLQMENAVQALAEGRISKGSRLLADDRDDWCAHGGHEPVIIILDNFPTCVENCQCLSAEKVEALKRPTRRRPIT